MSSERLQKRIKQGSKVAESGCWIWVKQVDKHGYGRIRVAPGPSGMLSSHRASYEAFVGPIPDGLQIDHLCRVTACVNPAHLEPVTQAENMRRRYVDRTHCKHGHEYTAENTYTYGGARICRACNRRRQAESKARRREAAA